MVAIGSFSLLRNCAVTQRAFSNVKVSESAAFSFNSIKFFHPPTFSKISALHQCCS
ncbi:hypothetical protein OIU77_000174 [Salix suchowensis]|uniref:Uncharacterized protein n=1 Tax=Salix suchowensis TaxID=1278906 RepID=A0ABQ9B5B3_9ROSI|nr:hypothetical protein OIU77_000174 [Salix suchowensis]